jgi:hypothetical protein
MNTRMEARWRERGGCDYGVLIGLWRIPLSEGTGRSYRMYVLHAGWSMEECGEGDLLS